jgi:hypothetical protein
MKIYVPIILFCSLLVLSGCVSQNKADEDDIKDEFYNKVECSKKQNEIKAKLDKITNEKPMIKNIALVEIFYSKKLNTCLFVSAYYDYGEHGLPYQFKLEDALTNEVVESASFMPYFNEDGSKDEYTWDKKEAFSEKIKSYK